MADKAKIAEIADKVFSLTSPKIEESRRASLLELLETTINGDEIKAHLVINLTFGKDRAGAGIYVLTNVRLIRVNVEPNEIKSSDLFLNKINIERKVSADKRTEIRISVGSAFFNLVYSDTDNVITEFFRQVDQARIIAEGRNA